MGFAMRLGKKSMVGWIGAVRPSRRPLSRPPQDEELSQCHQVLILILRSGQRARLEGRKAVMQPLRLNSCLASMLNPSYGSSRGNHVIVSAPNLEARLRRRSGARLPSPSACRRVGEREQTPDTRTAGDPPAVGGNTRTHEMRVDSRALWLAARAHGGLWRVGVSPPCPRRNQVTEANAPSHEPVAANST